MYIETKEIGPEGLVVDRTIERLPVPVEGDDLVGIDTVHLTGELRRESAGVSFAGDIGTVATLACSRCLEPYRLPLDLHFDLRFTPAAEGGPAGERRVDEDRIAETHFDGHRIDLGDVVAEQIYLGLPLKPLCRAECRGLCPGCGANLNLDACGCAGAGRPGPVAAS